MAAGGQEKDVLGWVGERTSTTHNSSCTGCTWHVVLEGQHVGRLEGRSLTQCVRERMNTTHSHAPCIATRGCSFIASSQASNIILLAFRMQSIGYAMHSLTGLFIQC